MPLFTDLAAFALSLYIAIACVGLKNVGSWFSDCDNLR